MARAPRVDGPVADATSPPTGRAAARPLERLLVRVGQPLAQLDEVAPGNRHRGGRSPVAPGRAARSPGRRAARGRTDAEVVLHPALGGQPVVVPADGVEDLLAAHPLEPGDRVGVGVGEDVADVQRAADRQRGSVDGVDVARGGAERSNLYYTPLAHRRDHLSSRPSSDGLAGIAGLACRCARAAGRESVLMADRVTHPGGLPRPGFRAAATSPGSSAAFGTSGPAGRAARADVLQRVHPEHRRPVRRRQLGWPRRRPCWHRT